jgi:hypothetical protein
MMAPWWHRGKPTWHRIAGENTELRDHVCGLGRTLLRTSFELVIDLTEDPVADVEWPTGVAARDRAKPLTTGET